MQKVVTAKAQKKAKLKPKEKKKLQKYWSIIEPKDYAKEMVAEKK